MPSWTEKDERQYERIKESNEDRGVSTKRSKEIAARTVNKNRRSKGKTPSSSTEGTGNPNTSLDDRSVDELRNIAQNMSIEGRSTMNKKELVSAIRKRR